MKESAPKIESQDTKSTFGAEQSSKENPSNYRKLKTVLKATALASLIIGHTDTHSPNKKESFSEIKTRAASEMNIHGITQEQEGAYIAGINDILYQKISPYGGADNIKEALDRFLKDFFGNRDKENMSKEDAWRLYLGMEQEHGTFGISDYKPSQSKDEKYYYKFNNIIKELPELKDLQRLIRLIKNGDVDEFSPTLNSAPYTGMSNVMGNFKWSLGEDEEGPYISYYDLWDLAVPLEKNGGFFGKPFEIYDRIYYDSTTFEIK